MQKITQATKEDAHLIHKLVHQIYGPTYSLILSDEQIQFMLEKNYTITSLHEAMDEGQDFYLIWDDQGNPVGFMALKSNIENVLRIEKLYLLPITQGKGFGTEFISFAEDTARNNKKSILELNVNRGNKAYYFYLKKGFKVIQEIDIPYHGYILDDYIMQKNVTD